MEDGNIKEMETMKAFGVNPIADLEEWRGCIGDPAGNCPYVCFNENGVPKCSIDNIVQVRWYGCRPSEIIAKIQMAV